MKRFEDRQGRDRIAYIFLIVVDDEVVSLGSGGSAFQDDTRGWVQSVEQSFGNRLTWTRRQRRKIHRKVAPLFLDIQWPATGVKTNRGCAGTQKIENRKCSRQSRVPAELDLRFG